MIFDTRPKVTINIPQTQETYPCALDESLLVGMTRLGRRGIPVGCVNGGCGVCKIRIDEGEVHLLGPVSRAHVSEEEQALGYTLACRAAPKTAITLSVVGKFEKPFAKGFATMVNQSTSNTKGD